MSPEMTFSVKGVPEKIVSVKDRILEWNKENNATNKTMLSMEFARKALVYCYSWRILKDVGDACASKEAC